MKSMLLSLLLVSLVYSQETLKKYAEKAGLDIGVAIKESYMGSNNTHNDIVKREFNTVVCENSMKAQSVAQSKTSYNFSQADKVVNFALKNGMKIRGHTLVWHSQNANWICTGERKSTLENMKYHIKKVMEHYKGKIYQWDVVNEAFADGKNGALRSSPWTQSVGEDFIDSAFVYAHRVDPECKLYINDYMVSISNTKSTGLYNKVKTMLENGIPVHGVGFQAHFPTSSGTPGFYDSVKVNYTRFAKLGVDLAITELDVHGDDTDGHARVYETFMKIALEMPEVKTFMIWGVRDQDSWLSPNPLIFDNNWKPKNSYNALLKLLKDPPPPDDPVNSTNIAPTTIGYRAVTSENSKVQHRNNCNTLTLCNVSTTDPATVELFTIDGRVAGVHSIPANRHVIISELPARKKGVFVLRTNKQSSRFVRVH